MRVRNSYVALTAFCLFVAMAASASLAKGGVPTDQIKATVDKALVVLRDPRFKAAAKAKERRDQLKQILFARFDFNEMAKRALGADWRRRTSTEQEEFVHLFTDLLERAYTETIESYTDEKIVYISEKLDGIFAEVASKILTSSSSPAASSSSNRADEGLSRSSTPRNSSFLINGTTISEFEALSQAMCPGKSFTFGTIVVAHFAAAVPHTPWPIRMRTQAGLPWNGPSTSSVPWRK